MQMFVDFLQLKGFFLAVRTSEYIKTFFEGFRLRDLRNLNGVVFEVENVMRVFRTRFFVARKEAVFL